MDPKPVKLKRYFLMLIAWVVAVVSIIGGSFLYKAYKGWEYRETAAPVVRQIVPVISEWDPVKTRALMAPEALAGIPEENFGKAMNLFSKLGTLESLDAPKFEEVVEITRAAGEFTTLLNYKVVARYSNGVAQWKIQLVDLGDSFQLYNFNVSSETLTGPAH